MNRLAHKIYVSVLTAWQVIHFCAGCIYLDGYHRQYLPSYWSLTHKEDEQFLHLSHTLFEYSYHWVRVPHAISIDSAVQACEIMAIDYEHFWGTLRLNFDRKVMAHFQSSDINNICRLLFLKNENPNELMKMADYIRKKWKKIPVTNDLPQMVFLFIVLPYEKSPYCIFASQHDECSTLLWHWCVRNINTGQLTNIL